MAEFRLSFDNLRDRYPVDKFIMLLPTVSKHIVAARPMFSLDVTTVKINPDDPNHVYPMEFEGYGDARRVTAVALTKVAIDLLCAAADADVIVGERYTNRSGALYAVFGAVASMRQPGGEVRSRTASVEWDGELVRDKLRFEAEEFVASAIAKKWTGKSDTGARWVDLDEAGRAKNVDLRFTKRWLAEREFGKRKAESKAARNALKALLAMPGTYHPEELRAKEFAVAKLVLTPDMTDPSVRNLMLEHGLRGQQQLWGAAAAAAAGGTFLPQQSPPQAFAALGAGQAVEADRIEPADDPVEPAPEPVAAPAPEPTWDEAQRLVPEIIAITAAWPGTPEGREKTVAAFMAAFAGRDAARIVTIHNHCIDARLAAANGGTK